MLNMQVVREGEDNYDAYDYDKQEQKAKEE